MKFYTFIFVSLVLSACGANGVYPVQVYSISHGPDGANNWIGIKCKTGIIHCYGQAGRMCPKGYELMNGAVTDNKHLIIKCSSNVKSPF